MPESHSKKPTNWVEVSTLLFLIVGFGLFQRGYYGAMTSLSTVESQLKEIELEYSDQMQQNKLALGQLRESLDSQQLIESLTPQTTFDLSVETLSRSRWQGRDSTIITVTSTLQNQSMRDVFVDAAMIRVHGTELLSMLTLDKASRLNGPHEPGPLSWKKTIDVAWANEDYFSHQEHYATVPLDELAVVDLSEIEWNKGTDRIQESTMIGRVNRDSFRRHNEMLFWPIDVGLLLRAELIVFYRYVDGGGNAKVAASYAHHNHVVFALD